MRGDVGMSGYEQGDAGFDYDGVRFRPVEAGHVPGQPTAVGLYHSRGAEMWAEAWGVIKDLFVEKPGAFEVSAAENVLKHL